MLKLYNVTIKTIDFLILKLYNGNYQRNWFFDI